MLWRAARSPIIWSVVFRQQVIGLSYLWHALIYAFRTATDPIKEPSNH